MTSKDRITIDRSHTISNIRLEIASCSHNCIYQFVSCERVIIDISARLVSRRSSHDDSIIQLKNVWLFINECAYAQLHNSALFKHISLVVLFASLRFSVRTHANFCCKFCNFGTFALFANLWSVRVLKNCYNF